MANKIEELLKPRYKVIADYPRSNYEVGEILCEGKSIAEWLCKKHDVLTGISIENAMKYPHLFKKLEWWEERSIDEMPEYISYVSLTLKDKYGDDETKNRIYVKVTSWHKNNKGEWYYNNNRFCDLGKSFLPHTEQEYLNHHLFTTTPATNPAPQTQ